MTLAVHFFGQPVTLLESAAMLTGLISVWLTARRNLLCFPAGIINVTLYFILFISEEVRLYADALLQVIFGLLLIYGWYSWSSGKLKKGIRVTRTVPKEWGWIILFIAAGTLLLGGFFSAFTNASYPWLDSWLTSASLAAQWMIARKKPENWLLWIAVDVVYIPLYWSKNLPLTAVLYLIFLMICIKGWNDWSNEAIQTEPVK